jgi:hypothetical protein
MDVPYNLEPDGGNYVEWTWSLLDDGIDISGQASFSTLRTPDGQPLLEADTAEYLDEQMVIAKKAAVAKGHDIADVILCCRAPDINSDAVADELAKQFFLDTPLAMARAKALGEICDIAEDFNISAMHLKMNLATDELLPKPLREALNGPVDVRRRRLAPDGVLRLTGDRCRRQAQALAPVEVRN